MTECHLRALAKAYNDRQIGPIMAARHEKRAYNLEPPTLEEEAGLLLLAHGNPTRALEAVRYYHAHNTCHGEECVSWAALESLLEGLIHPTPPATAPRASL